MKPSNILPGILAILTLTACESRRNYSTADFDRPLYTPAYAAGFDIRGTENDAAALITIRNPWQGAEKVEQHLLVLHDDNDAPIDFDGQTVRAPVHRVACLSSSHVALFDALGEVRRIKGVSGIDYIANPYVRAHRLCGEVRDIGYDTNLDFELLAVMRPSIVLLYGVTGENTAVTGKLRELDIPYIYIGDYLEPSPLGKAEWLVVAAELCGCRDRGTAVFDRIAERYNATAQCVRAYVEPLAKAAVAAGADGLMIETHPCPEKALSRRRLPAQGSAEHALPRYMVHAARTQLHGAAHPRRRRRHLHLLGGGQQFAARRSGTGLPACQRCRRVAQRGLVQHAR